MKGSAERVKDSNYQIKMIILESLLAIFE